ICTFPISPPPIVSGDINWFNNNKEKTCLLRSCSEEVADDKMFFSNSLELGNFKLKSTRGSANVLVKVSSHSTRTGRFNDSCCCVFCTNNRAIGYKAAVVE